MLGNGEIAEELLTVSEVAAALKVPVSWVYKRTRPSRTDQERCAMPHPATFSAGNTTKTSSGKAYGLEPKRGLDLDMDWTWTERRAVLARGCVQTRPFI
jgi:hypothetical protein